MKKERAGRILRLVRYHFFFFLELDRVRNQLSQVLVEHSKFGGLVGFSSTANLTET